MRSTMDGTWTFKRRYGVRSFALALLLSAPAQAGAPVDDPVDTSAAEPASENQSFTQEFADLAPLPDAPDPASNPGLDAVDLDHFEPPQGPAVIRSLGSGKASYYGKRFHGRTTANGERFDMHAMTAAHKTLPFGSKVRVTNPRNGKSVTVTINDRGPYAHGRVIDLSRAAAQEIGLIRRGHGTVEMELVEG